MPGAAPAPQSPAPPWPQPSDPAAPSAPPSQASRRVWPAFVVAALVVLTGAVAVLVVALLDVRNQLERATDRAGELSDENSALGDRIDDLDDDLTQLDDDLDQLDGRIAALGDQLTAALPRLQTRAAMVRCQRMLNVEPLPAGWIAHCVDQDPTDQNFGLAEGFPSSGDVTVFYGELFDRLGLDSEFDAEMRDTFAHEAHHAWCLALGGEAGHGTASWIPTCSVAVSVRPPVGDWGGADG
jgi:hypothetical protein